MALYRYLHPPLCSGLSTDFDISQHRGLKVEGPKNIIMLFGTSTVRYLGVIPRRLQTNVAKLRKLGGKVSLTEEIYTSPRNRIYIP